MNLIKKMLIRTLNFIKIINWMKKYHLTTFFEKNLLIQESFHSTKLNLKNTFFILKFFAIPCDGNKPKIPHK